MGNYVVVGALGDSEEVKKTSAELSNTYEYEIYAESYRNYAELRKSGLTLRPKKTKSFCGTSNSIKLTFEAIEIPISELGAEELTNLSNDVKELKDEGFVLNEDATLVYRQQEGGKPQLAPWDVMAYKQFPSTALDDCRDCIAEYWSSLQSHAKYSSESRVFSHSMRVYPKIVSNVGSLVNMTSNIAHLMQLSSESAKKIRELSSGKAWGFHTDGDNQIWRGTSSPYVFKMIPCLPLYEHELYIYSLDLPHLPKLKESWIVEETNEHPAEYFLCLEYKGISLASSYGLKALLPPKVKEQMDLIIADLFKSGIDFKDAHLGNFVIDKEGVVWAIDCESMISRATIDLLKSINEEKKKIQTEKGRDYCTKEENEAFENRFINQISAIESKDSVEFLKYCYSVLSD